MKSRTLLSHRWITALASLALIGYLSAIGCTTPGMTEDKSRAVSSLAELEEGISKANAQIDETIQAADALTNAADLTAAYETFVDEIDETRDMQKRAAKRRADMSVNADAYIADWTQQAATLNNPQLRSAATERAAKIKELFTSVRTKAEAAKDAYEPFISNLDDLEAYLKNDLTPAGVKAADPALKQVAVSGTKLKEAVDAYEAELKKAMKALEAGPTGEAKTTD